MWLILTTFKGRCWQIKQQIFTVFGLGGICFFVPGGLLGTPAVAQSPPPENTEITVNYVYAALLGLGKYDAGGLSVQIYTLPLEYTFDSPTDDHIRLQIQLPISYGRFEFDGTAPDGTQLGFTIDTLGATPGVELQIPLTSQWTLKPFGNVGLFDDFSQSRSSSRVMLDLPLNYVFIVGGRSLVSEQVQEVTLSLGNAVIYAGNGAFSGGGVESFTTVETGLDAQFPLGFTVKGYEPDMNIFLIHYHFFPEATFTRFLQNPLNIEDQFEIGGAFGTVSPLEIGFINNLRLGASYRFGGGLTAIVFNFGFPF